jgi:acetyltransferase-like isoleucine patch superfamily enzyme
MSTLRKIPDFISRRLRFALKKITSTGSNISIHKSCDIKFSASLDAQYGKITIGKHSIIDKGAILRTYGGYIYIGDNCSVNPYCILYGEGGLTIGNGVRIGAHTAIITANHIFNDPGKFIFLQGMSKKGIVIEDDVWIGAGVQIVDGVILSKGTVVGAGSVVTKSTKPYAVIVGVPAKVISYRNENN